MLHILPLVIICLQLFLGVVVIISLTPCQIGPSLGLEKLGLDRRTIEKREFSRRQTAFPHV